MAKAYIMALVKFTDKDSFLQNYASKVADVFPNMVVTFQSATPKLHIKKDGPLIFT